MKNPWIKHFICVFIIYGCNGSGKENNSAEIIQKIEELKEENKRLREDVAEIRTSNSTNENIHNEQTINTVKDDYVKTNKNNEIIVYVNKIYEDIGTNSDSQTKTKLHVRKPFNRFHFVHAAPGIFLANAYILEESIIKSKSGRLFFPISAIQNQPNGYNCSIRILEYQPFYEIFCAFPNDKVFRESTTEETVDLMSYSSKYAVINREESVCTIFAWYWD